MLVLVAWTSSNSDITFLKEAVGIASKRYHGALDFLSYGKIKGSDLIFYFSMRSVVVMQLHQGNRTQLIFLIFTIVMTFLTHSIIQIQLWETLKVLEENSIGL